MTPLGAAATQWWQAKVQALEDENERLREELERAKRYGETTYAVECRLREQRDSLRGEVRRLRDDNERLSELVMRATSSEFAVGTDEKEPST
jgi:predicted nuclease with TOPRIM domain